MPEVRQEAIRTLANSLWEADGRPEGRDLDYWLAAERTLSQQAEAAAPAAEAPVAPAKPRRKSPAKPRATKPKA
jgi:hypothetical protein